MYMPQFHPGAYALLTISAPRSIGFMKDPKEQLTARRDELKERLARLDGEARRATEPLLADFAEQAVQRENDEVVDRLREATAADLRSISLALTRLENGTYGVCIDCGKRIESARLEVMPASPRCMSCED
jgi:RNA polymerase-binding transcription factor DksA